VNKFSIAIFAAATFAAVSVPAAAQIAGAASFEFVNAVKNRDGDKAMQALGDNPSPAVLNARDGDGDTGLIIAVSRRDREWTGFLLNKGADPNIAGKNGDTPLIIASRLGFDEAAEWLLSMGAKVDMANKMGETALITAVQQRQTPVVKLLLSVGADPDKTDTAAGYSARDYAQRDTRARDILQLIQAKKPKTASAH
jgi:ankyrin repeat protein